MEKYGECNGKNYRAGGKGEWIGSRKEEGGKMRGGVVT